MTLKPAARSWFRIEGPRLPVACARLKLLLIQNEKLTYSSQSDFTDDAHFIGYFDIYSGGRRQFTDIMKDEGNLLLKIEHQLISILK